MSEKDHVLLGADGDPFLRPGDNDTPEDFRRFAQEPGNGKGYTTCRINYPGWEDVQARQVKREALPDNLPLREGWAQAFEENDDVRLADKARGCYSVTKGGRMSFGRDDREDGDHKSYRIVGDPADRLYSGHHKDNIEREVDRGERAPVTFEAVTAIGVYTTVHDSFYKLLTELHEA